MMRGVRYRQPDDGLPHADAVMERGMLVPMSHGLTDVEVEYVCEQIATFLEPRRRES
jgi:CDP-6-deoxy-D-xylo-4-hexulose-3-dehydrase